MLGISGNECMKEKLDCKDQGKWGRLHERLFGFYCGLVVCECWIFARVLRCTCCCLSLVKFGFFPKHHEFMIRDFPEAIF